MDYPSSYPSRRSGSCNLTTEIYLRSIDLTCQQLKSKDAGWSLGSMYPQKQQLNGCPPGKRQLLATGVNKNAKNYNFSRMYSTKPSLSVDSMSNQPKKETLWQTFFRGATNLLSEQLYRGAGSFSKSWSNMNNPLSVTVVSPDFYKSLQRGNDQLINTSDKFFTTQVPSSEESVPNFLYLNEILSDSAKRINNYNSSDTNDSDKRWEEYKCMYVDCNGSQENDFIRDQKIVNSVNNSDCKNCKSHFNMAADSKKALDNSANFGNTLLVDEDKPVILEKLDIPDQALQAAQHQSQSQSPILVTEVTPVSAMLTNAYNKVVNSMADILKLRSSSPEPPAALFTKRACSPNFRTKRLHNISSVRGRGRAKSQLRRSGVSQRRHRKERSRYDKSEDIKSDIDNWEEHEYSTSDQDGVDVCDFASSSRGDDTDDVVVLHTKHTSAFTIADIIPRKRKSRTVENSPTEDWEYLNISLSVQSLDKDCGAETDCKEKLIFRPRLMSESSIDSDDSYCIVFEDKNPSEEETDFETEEDSYVETETEAATEEDEDVEADTEVEIHPTKVRFDPTPIVHTMIHWNYAYRAARRGPWEEMARDRERFRTRINSIGQVLKPVLEKQHRTRIWHERFVD